MKRYSIITIMALLLLTGSLYGKWSIYTEAGAAITGYNDVKIPNDNLHDEFSLNKDLDAETVLSGRINLFYEINSKHRLALLYSPLTIKSKGSFDRDIRYRELTFEALEPVEATYRFDSYRLQYSYHFANPKAILRYVGASLKLRNAGITLKNDTQETGKTNIGFVPLLSLGLGYDFSETIGLSMDAEGLGSPFGRAEDVLTALNFRYNDKLNFRMGYRFLEGGSDGDEVYTFAWIHYPVMGMVYSF